MEERRGPMNADELNTLLNSWPEGTRGHEQDREVIARLDDLGAKVGYGFLAQLAQLLYSAQCHCNRKPAADLKRERFGSLDWPLPITFEKVAGS